MISVLFFDLIKKHAHGKRDKPPIGTKYPDVFMEGLGTLKGVKAKIYVDQGAEPKYIKARSVPYALKTNVELEL